MPDTLVDAPTPCGAPDGPRLGSGGLPPPAHRSRLRRGGLPGIPHRRRGLRPRGPGAEQRAGNGPGASPAAGPRTPSGRASEPSVSTRTPRSSPTTTRAGRSRGACGGCCATWATGRPRFSTEGGRRGSRPEAQPGAEWKPGRPAPSSGSRGASGSSRSTRWMRRGDSWTAASRLAIGAKRSPSTGSRDTSRVRAATTSP